MIFRWMFVNVFTLVVIVAWSLSKGYDSNLILVGKMVSQSAFALFLVNINMYFVFLLIRKSKVREVKIKLAKISKKMMKYHVPLAITATLLIISHAGIMIAAYMDKLWMAKTISGSFAIALLCLLLYSGLLRRWKASGPRRKFHYMMAFLFMGFAILHILI